MMELPQHGGDGENVKTPRKSTKRRRLLAREAVTKVRKGVRVDNDDVPVSGDFSS